MELNAISGGFCGLSEAFKESLRGSVFTPWYPCVRSKQPLEPQLLDFPQPGENDDYCLELIDPYRGASCRSLLVVGIMKGLIDRV